MTLEIIFERPFTDWGLKIGIYITLVGIAGGAYLMGYLDDLLNAYRPEGGYGQVSSYGYLIGLLGIGIGGPVLLSHLGAPIRAALIPLTMTNLESWMARGSYLIPALAIGSLLMFIWTAFGTGRPGAGEADESVATDGGSMGGIRSVTAKIGIGDHLDAVADATRPPARPRLAIGGLFGIVAAVALLYSAMALGSGSTGRVELWTKQFLIPVQMTSGLGVGMIAAVGLAAIVERSLEPAVDRYAAVGAIILVGTLLSLVVTVLQLPDQSATAASSVDALMTTYGWLFLGGAVVIGLVIPILLVAGTLVAIRQGQLSPSHRVKSFVAAGALAVLGKFALTFSYMLAAEYRPLEFGVVI